jgi:hypothetical protein
MRSSPPRLALFLALPLAFLAACDKLPFSSGARPGPPPRRADLERVDDAERAAATKLVPVQDPVFVEIDAYVARVRNDFLSARFESLETEAADLRATKPRFGNGSWKIVAFYEAFTPLGEVADPVWEQFTGRFQAWLEARPQSVTARIAYAEFLTAYAWHARGTGYADTVTEEGWRKMAQRLDQAMEVLTEAREVPDAAPDPCWYLTALTVALGQGWPPEDYEALLADAHALEPEFWGFDAARAKSLLPRWYGEPGDWEAYAAAAAARPNGLGAEGYARIVLHLMGYYEHVFRQTKASWPMTREGLEILLEKHPESLDLRSRAALLAVMAQDQPYAKARFDDLGDRYLPDVWPRPESFAHYRNWAETGQW